MKNRKFIYYLGLILPVAIYFIWIAGVSNKEHIILDVPYCKELADEIELLRLKRTTCYWIVEQEDILYIKFEAKNGYAPIDFQDVLKDLFVIKECLIQYINDNSAERFKCKKVQISFREDMNKPEYIFSCSNYDSISNELRADYTDFSVYECKKIDRISDIVALSDAKYMEIYAKQADDVGVIQGMDNLIYIDFKNTIFTTEQKKYIQEFGQEHNCKVLYK